MSISIYGIFLIALVVGVLWFAFRLLLEHDVGEAFLKGALVFVLAAVVLLLGNLLAPQLFVDADGIIRTGWEVAKNGPGRLNPVIDLKKGFSSQSQVQSQSQEMLEPQNQEMFAPTTSMPTPKPPEKGDTRWDDSPALALAECYGSPQNLLLVSLQKRGFPLWVQWDLSGGTSAFFLPSSLEKPWTMKMSVLGVGSWQITLDPSMAHTIKDQLGDKGVGQLPWPRVLMEYDGTQWVPKGDCQWP